MADNHDLIGPNNEAEKPVGQTQIPTTPIKSDNEVVGGVTLGAIDSVNLDAENFDELVRTSVDAALKFAPTPPQAIQSAVAQFRRNVITGAPAYLTARSTIGHQLEALVARQDKTIKTGADRRAAVTSLILERTLTSGLRGLQTTNLDILTTSRDQLRFQTSVATTYMKQSLALSYHQLYSTKNLITLTKAFAEMVENKLEAIKINTKLPDVSKTSFLRRARETLTKEALSQGSKALITGAKQVAASKVVPAVVGYLGADTRPDLRISDRISNATSGIADLIRKTKLGSSALDVVQARATGLASALSPFAAQLSDRIKPFAERHKLAEKFHPDVLWQKSAAQRKMAANLLHSVAGTQESKSHTTEAPPHPTESTIHTERQRAPPDRHHPTPVSGLTRKDLEALVTSRLDKIYTLLDERLSKTPRENSFEDYKRRHRSEYATGARTAEQVTGGGAATRGGILGSVASLLSGKHGDKEKPDKKDSEEPSVARELLEYAGETVFGGLVGNRILRAGRAGLRGLRAGATSVGRAASRFLGKAGTAGAVGTAAAGLAESVPGVAAAGLAEAAPGAAAAGLAASAPAAAAEVVGAAAAKAAPGAAATGAAGANTAAKVAGGIGLRGTAAGAGKILFTKLPLVGLAKGAGRATQRAWDGDYFGAAGELAGGLASTVPGWGTAASIAIEGGLQLRDMQRDFASVSGNRGNLLKSRMNAYGADNSNADAVRALEERAYHILTKQSSLIRNSASRIKYEELQEIAKKFGFDPTNFKAMEYFNKWVSGRFYTAFQAYLSILTQHRYSFDKEANIPDSDVTLILDEFNRAASGIAVAYKDYAPSPKMFRDRADNLAVPQVDGVGLQQPVESIRPPQEAQGTGISGNPLLPSPVQYSAPRVDNTPSVASQASHIITTTDLSAPGAGVHRAGAPGASPVSGASLPSYMSTPPVLAPGAVAVGGHYTSLPTAAPSAHVAATARLSYTPGGSSSPASGPAFVPAQGAANTNGLGMGYKKQVGGQTWDQKSPAIMANLMRDFGFTKEQAAGIVGNLGHECGGLTEMQERNPVGGGRGGLGWAQWTGERRVTFEKYCKDHNLDTYSDEANYGFLRHELQTEYKSAVRDVKQTNSTEGAMRAFETRYEAAGIKHYESRQRFADAALNVYNATPPSTAEGTNNSAPGAAPTGPNSTQLSANTTGVASVTGASTPSSSGNDTASGGGSAANPVSTLPSGVVGSGQCVDLVKKAAGIGHTSEWNRGEAVLGNQNLRPGTAIACFDRNGRYGNHTDGSSHAAIYLGPSTVYPGGIRVYDQWNGQPAHERDIRPAGGSAVNSARSYSVINSGGTAAVAAGFGGQSPVPQEGSPDTVTPTGGATADGKTASSDTSPGRPQPDTAVSEIAGNSQRRGGNGSPTSSAGLAAPDVEHGPSGPSLPPTTGQTNSSMRVGPSIGPRVSSSPTSPLGAVTGPMQSIIAPISAALSGARTRKQEISTLQQQSRTDTLSPPLPPAHPELLATGKATVDAIEKSIAAMGGIHSAVQGLHSTVRDAHGPEGVFADMNNHLRTSATQPASLLTPIINHITGGDTRSHGTNDDDLDVSKLRRPRYEG